jgi:hypothetical protein
MAKPPDDYRPVARPAYPEQERLEQIRARAEAATPGPWEFDSYCRVICNPDVFCDDEHDGVNLAYVPAWNGDTACQPHSDNAEFIANARADIPYLLDRLAASEREVDVLRVALKPFTDEFIGEDARCHMGIVPMERCVRCGPILRARAALGLP